MDTDLVMQAQRGDEEAFASLAMAVGNRLHQVAHRILRDLDLAEDATQQALLSIWRDLPQLRDPARFEVWSYRLHRTGCPGRHSRVAAALRVDHDALRHRGRCPPARTEFRLVNRDHDAFGHVVDKLN